MSIDTGFVMTGVVLFVTFLGSMFASSFWIKAALRNGLAGRDMNKNGGRKIAEAGGIAFIASLTLAVLLFVFLKTFLLKTDNNLVEMLILLCTLLLAGFIGFTDDILGWKKGFRKLHKPLLTLPIAIPLVVINAGDSVLQLPFFGFVDFGILYPLLLIPIGIVGASNGYNMLAGYNGVEASVGIVIFSALGYKLYNVGALWLAFTCFAASLALLGFLVYNKYPARLFPGDTLTYSVGALIAAISILGNVQKIAVILFAPFFLEAFLKARSRFGAETFGILQKDGTLRGRYAKSYSIFHIILKWFPRIFGRGAKEYETVFIVVVAEIILAVIALFVAV